MASLFDALLNKAKKAKENLGAWGKVLTDQPTRQYVAKNLNPVSLASNYRVSSDKPTVGQAVSQVLSQGANKAFNPFQDPAVQKGVLSRPAKVLSNTAQSQIAGYENIFKGLGKYSRGIDERKYGQAAEGLLESAFGAGKVLSTAKPSFQAANVITALPQMGQTDLARRLASGYIEGMTGEDLATNVPQRKTNLGPLGESDIARVAGSIVGYGRNPTIGAINKYTGIINRAPLFKNALAQYLATRGVKGSTEGFLEGLGEMPEGLSSADRARFMRGNILTGAAGEIVTDKGFELLGKGGHKLWQGTRQLPNVARNSADRLYNTKTGQWVKEAADKVKYPGLKPEEAEFVRTFDRQLKRQGLTPLEFQRQPDLIRVKPEGEMGLVYKNPNKLNPESDPKSLEKYNFLLDKNRRAKLERQSGKIDLEAEIGQTTKEAKLKALEKPREAVQLSIDPQARRPEPLSPQEGKVDVSSPDSNKYAFNINKKRLGLDKKAAEKLDKVADRMRPVLESRKGKPLTSDEIIEGGRKSIMLEQVMDRKEAAEFSKRLQASRNFLKAASQEKGVTPEYLAQLEIVSSQAADTGRRLRAFAVEAEDKPIKEKLLKELKDLGIKSRQLVEASKGVDWDNAEEVTEFYRKFKPASLAEKLNEYRYVNMLSSPNTHLVNSFSNFLQTGVVAPIEKTVTGQLDWIRSRLTGKQQEYFAKQGVDYTKAYYKHLPEAWQVFKDTLRGEAGLNKPDIDFIPTSTSKAQKWYTTPLRALEANDRFFKYLTMAGEEASLKRQGVTGAEALKKAERSAEYRLFRQKFDPEGKYGQNVVLQTWDKWNSYINGLRRLPGGKWLVPFLQTPTNILKQGVEYSPVGIVTVPGSKEPMVQLAKTAIGSTVFAGAYALANAGLATWDVPTNRNEKSEFYAAGLQPYALKIGDKWISYSKLGPLSYPIAMAAAVNWSSKNGVGDDKIKEAMSGATGFLQFFSDQSYVRGLGDWIDAARGDEFELQRALSNIPSQLIPYRAFQGWIARLVDPVYRKASNPVESMQTQIPFASKSLDPYTTPDGKPSTRDMPFINALSPAKVTEEKPEYMNLYQSRRAGRQIKREEGLVYDALKDGTVPNFGGLNTRSSAEGVYRYLKSLEKEERQQAYRLIRNDLPEEVKKELFALGQLDNRGYSSKDRRLMLIPPEIRARAIYDRLMDLSPKSREKKYRELVQLGVITPDIKPVLFKLGKGGKK